MAARVQRQGRIFEGSVSALLLLLLPPPLPVDCSYGVYVVVSYDDWRMVAGPIKLAV